MLLIFGAEDQVYDADEAIAAYEDVPGVRTEVIEGAGHSPNVEQPEETARLILEFAAEAERGAAAAKRKQGKAKRGRKRGRQLAEGRLAAAYRQRPPAFAHSRRCSREQKSSGMRCSPRWWTSRTWTSPSSRPHWAQLSGPSSIERGSLGDLTGLPVGSLDPPRDHVLEAAERRPPLPRRLVHAEAVVPSRSTLVPHQVQELSHG